MDGGDAAAVEDLFSPGAFRLVLRPGSDGRLRGLGGRHSPFDRSHGPRGRRAPAHPRPRRRERGARSPICAAPPTPSSCARPARAGPIVSGYPSGMKSAREALIALPGLCLATGRHEDARALLLSPHRAGRGRRAWARARATRRAAGDALDTGLWWVVTVERFREATGDHEFIRSKLQGALLAILEGYRAGTRRGVGVSRGGPPRTRGRRQPAGPLRERRWRDLAARLRGRGPGALVQRAHHRGRPGPRRRADGTGRRVGGPGRARA